MGMLGTFRSFASVLREISFDEVRDEAETTPRLLILAPSSQAARQLGVAITGPEGELLLTPRELTAQVGELGRFDAVVVHDPTNSGALAAVREQVSRDNGETPVLRFDGSGEDDSPAINRFRTALVSRLPERAPAFGRAFPSFRQSAAKAVVDETAKANAQFALVSNIPAVVPIVGSLAAAGADFLVLTKNQIMMIFKLAAIYGRDLGDQWGILQEMVPVVGAGFAWRTVAREAASFVPLAAGTIPKVVIAYAGTLSTGRAAAFYYRTNKRPSREQIQGYYQQASELVRKLPLPLPGRDGDAPPDALPAASDQPMASGNANVASLEDQTVPPASDATASSTDRDQTAEPGR